jgi:hypothetical protein
MIVYFSMELLSQTVDNNLLEKKGRKSHNALELNNACTIVPSRKALELMYVCTYLKNNNNDIEDKKNFHFILKCPLHTHTKK